MNKVWELVNLLHHFHPLVLTHFYRPQTKLREGNVFTPVYDSVHGEGGLCQGDTPPVRQRADGTYPTGMQ